MRFNPLFCIFLAIMLKQINSLTRFGVNKIPSRNFRGFGRNTFRDLRFFLSHQVDSKTDETKDLLEIDLPTNENNQNLLKKRHSTAHVMAMAVQKVFPEALVTIGPWIENG